MPTKLTQKSSRNVNQEIFNAEQEKIQVLTHFYSIEINSKVKSKCETRNVRWRTLKEPSEKKSNTTTFHHDDNNMMTRETNTTDNPIRRKISIRSDNTNY